MTSSPKYVAVGGVLFGAIGLALAVLLRGASNSNMYVDLPKASGAFVVLSPTARLPSFHAEPADLKPRTELLQWQRREESHLWLQTFMATWGNRWEQEVTVPVLQGPYHAADQFVCGYEVGVTAATLDTKGTARPLVEALTARLKSLRDPLKYPVNVCGIRGTVSIALPPMSSSDLSFTFGPGYLQPHLAIGFSDGSWIKASSRLHIDIKDGRPVIEVRERPLTSVGGAMFSQLEADIASQARNMARDQKWNISDECLEKAGFFAAEAYKIARDWVRNSTGRVVGEIVAEEAEARARDAFDRELPGTISEGVRREVESVVLAVNDGMAALAEPLFPFSGDDSTSIAFRMRSAPSISPDGIRASLCLQWTGADIFGDESVPGPVAFPFEAAPVDLVPDRPAVHVRASVDALNQLLWGLWRSGKIREQGKLSKLLAIFDESKRGEVNEQLQKLIFEPTGIDPRLPPVLDQDGNSIVLTVANATLGTFEGKAVVGHAHGVVTVDQTGDDVRLAFGVRRLGVNCRKAHSKGARLEPCFSDLLGPFREQVQDSRPTLNLAGTELLAKLAPLGFSGIRLALSGLQVRTLPGPSLDLIVTPSFVPIAGGAAQPPMTQPARAR